MVLATGWATAQLGHDTMEIVSRHSSPRRAVWLESVSRYSQLYRDRRRLDWLGWVTIQSIVSGQERASRWGNCVTIQSLYRDKRAVWLRVCHDIIECIVIVKQRLGQWLCCDTDATR